MTPFLRKVFHEQRIAQDLGGIVGGGLSLIGGLAGADAAGSAADAQTNAINQGTALTNAQYQQTRQDNLPWLQAGQAGVNRLAYMLGLSTISGLPGSGAGTPSRQDIFNQYEAQLAQNGTDVPYSQLTGADQARRDATVDRLYNDALNQYQTSQLGTAQQDPAYGSLLRNFSSADLESDPIFQRTYQTALDTGEKGVNRLAASSGSLNSGATLKALQRSASDITNNYAGDAYNRFNNNNSQIYNRLAGISGSGQQASNTISSSGMNAANNASQNAIAAGNVRGASGIAAGNALAGGLSGAFNNYQSSQLLNRLYQPNVGIPAGGYMPSNAYNLGGAFG